MKTVLGAISVVVCFYWLNKAIDKQDIMESLEKVKVQEKEEVV